MFFQKSSPDKRFHAEIRSILSAASRFDRLGAAPLQSLVHIESSQSGNRKLLASYAADGSGVSELTARFDAQGAGRFLRTLQRVAPEVAFDFEWKVNTIMRIGRETLAYRETFVEAAQALETAEAQGDESRSRAIVNQTVQNALNCLQAVGATFVDRQSAFGRRAYDQAQAQLKSLSVEKQRQLYAFFAEMDAAEATYRRVLIVEFPEAVAREHLELRQILVWVDEIHQVTMASISRAVELLED